MWVEQPTYAQVAFAFHQLKLAAAVDAKLADTEPFKTVLSGDAVAIAKLAVADLMKVVSLTHSGTTVEAFQQAARAWLSSAQHPRFKRRYTELTYQPMHEVLQYLRANGYRTFIVTGGGQDFVRSYVEEVYGIPRDQVIGSAGGISFGHDASGNAVLSKNSKLLWIDDKAGKAENIHLMIGRPPVMAFGNADGDQAMLEYTEAGGGPRFMLLVHHDDAQREYAYGAESLMSPFSEALLARARKGAWIVASMKNEWKRIFTWQS